MAANGMANKYVVADKFEALAELWRMMVFSPDLLIEEYTSLWNSQLTDPALFFNKTRDDFNTTKSPSALLYLIARCVKNAIRFNSNGDFNQGADHRKRSSTERERRPGTRHAPRRLRRGLASTKG